MNTSRTCSLMNTTSRPRTRSAKAMTAVAGEPVGLDRFGRLVGGLAPAAAVAMMTAGALAGPDGAQVVNGNVTIQRQGDKTVIHASNNAIINYRNFDIARHETVQFVQPDALARVLNRINSPAPTKIDGSLLANGRVFIVNPAGVVFGRGAVVNAAGLYAAAGNITDSDFVKGIYRFTDVRGSVSNHGTIQAGDVALIGKSVANSGTIVADRGSVVMASGDSVLVGEVGGRIFVRLENDHPGPGRESGSSRPAGNNPWAVGDMYSMAIRSAGNVKAKQVHLEAKAGVVAVEGVIDASTTAAGRTGGDVSVLGPYVGVSGSIDASGPAGGGRILVGGNYQGVGPEANAIRTTVTTSGVLRADATEAGHGGTVIVWSDDQTDFAGRVSARGAGDQGLGGFAEVSGKQNLRFRGEADLSGPMGNGSLLLDPAVVTLTGGTSDGAADGTDTFSGDPSGTAGAIAFADTGPTTVFESEIEGLVAALTANIVIQATDSINATGTFTNGLELGATNFSLQTSNATTAGTINLSGVTISSTTGNIQVLGSTSGVETSTITLGPISTGTGGVTVSNGRGALTVGGNIETLGGGINLTTLDGALNVNAAMAVTGAGNIVLNSSGGTTTVTSTLTTGGAITLGNSGSGSATISGNLTGSTGVTLTNPSTLSGNVTLRSTNGPVTVLNTLDTGAGGVTLRGEQIDLGGGAGSVAGTGALVIRPESDSASISIGDAGTGTFDFDATDVGALGSTFSAITIGAAAGGGLATIGNATFNAPVTVIQGAAGGQIVLAAGATLQTSNDTVTLTAGSGDAALLSKPDTATINAGNALITLTGDRMDLGTAAGTILTTGAVILQPLSPTRDIVIAGADNASQFALSAAEIVDVVSGESALTIGRSNGQHAITLNGIDFDSPTTIRTPSGGSITVGGTVSAPSLRLQGAKTFATGANVTGNTDLLLDGGSSTVTGATVSLSGGTGTLTTGAIGVGTNALTLTGDEITINGAITGSGGSSVVLQPSANGVSIDVGINSGGSGTLDISDAEIANITGVGALTIGRAAGTHAIEIRDVVFSVPVTIRTPSGGSIALNGHAEAPALRLQGVKTFGTSGQLTASAGTVTLDGGAGTLSANLTVTGDEINLGSSIGGAFTLTLRPNTDVFPIIVGGVEGTPGTLDVSDTDLSFISGVSQLNIGRGTGTHAITIDSSTFNDPVLIRGGALTTIGTLTGTDDATITLTGSSISLGSNIVTSGRAVSLQGPVTLTSASPLIDTTNSGGVAAGANVTVTGAVNAQSAGTQGLSVTAGTGGTVNLQSAVGGGAALSSLSLNGGTLTFGAITTTGDASLVSRTALSTSALLTIGGQASFETWNTPGVNIAVTNAGNQFGSVFARTRSGDGSGSSVVGDIQVVETGNTTLVEGSAGGSFTLTSTGDILLTGPISAGTTVSTTGVGFTSNAGAFIQATDGGVAINHTGAVVVGDEINAWLNAGTQSIGITGSSVAINATVQADDAVTVTALSGAASIAADVISDTSSVTVSGVDVTITPGGQITAATTATVNASGNLQVGGDVTAPTSILLHAGNDGTGNLTFTAGGVDLSSASITLRAGDGAGGPTAAFVDALTNAPAFRGAGGGATSPATYVHRQDASIANSQIADAGQFQAATNVQGVDYTLRSDDGAVQLTDASKVAGSILTIIGASPFVIASNLDFGNGTVTLGPSEVQASGVEVSVGTGTLTFNGTLAVNANNLTLTGDEIDFLGGAGSVTGTGDLVLRPSAGGLGIGIGTAEIGGRLDLSDVDLAALAGTFNLVTVGRSGGTHAFTVDSATINNPFLFRGATAALLDNPAGAALTGVGRGSATFSTTTITLHDDIRTQGGVINLDGNVILSPTTGNSITVLSTDAGDPGADILFGGTTNSDGTARDLISNSGIGLLTFSGAVGTTPLASLTGTGSLINLPAVTTTGSQAYTGAASLGGNLSSTASGSISLNGTVGLAGPVTIQTAGLAGTDDITITGAITGAGNGLTLNSGAQGDISLLGNATGLSTLTATGSSIATRNVTSTGAQSYTGPTTVTGNIATTAAGSATFTGNATVTGNVSTTAGNILFNNNAAIGGNLTTTTSGLLTVTGTTTLTGASQTFQTANQAIALGPVTGASALTLNSGSAAITLGQVGATPLASLAATGSTITTSSTVATTGNQTYTGAPTFGGNLTTTGGSATVTGGTTLAAPVTIQTAGGAINLAAVNGAANPLTLNAGAGNIVLSGAATGLSSLAGTGANISLRAVTTTGNQSYTGATALGGNLSSTGAGSIVVNGPTSLVQTVTIQTAGGVASDDVTLAGVTGSGNGLTISTGAGDTAITGAATGLSALTITGSTISLNSVSSTGNQVYNGVTTATGNLQTTTAGSATFNGNATLGGNVSTSGGGILFNNNASLAGDLTSAGGGITVIGGTTLAGASQNFSSTGGGITLADVTGPANLSLSAPGGAISVGTVGATPLQSFAASAPTITMLGSVQTAGGQLFDGATTFAGNLVSAGGDVQVTGDATATPLNFTITTNDGSVTFGGNVTGTGTNLLISAGAGDVDLRSVLHAVDVPSLISLGVTGRDVFVGRVSTSGGQTYAASRTVETFGQLRAAGASNLSLSGVTSVRLRDNLVTGGSGSITLTGPVIIDAGSVALATGGGNISIVNGVNSATDGVGALTANAGAGTVTFGGNVGTAAGGRLASVSATGSSIVIPSITTSGPQQFTGPATLNGDLNAGALVSFSNTLTLLRDAQINASGGATFAGTVDGQAAGQQSLTVAAGSSPVTFQQAVGGLAALEAFSATGAVSVTSVTTSGSQTYSGQTVGSGNLVSGGGITASGAFTANGDINASGPLVVDADDQNVSLGGVTSALSVALRGANIGVGPVTSTGGGQVYTGPTSFQGDVLATGGGIAVNGPATLGGSATRSFTALGQTVAFGDILGDGRTLAITASGGTIDIQGDVSGLSSLSADAASILLPSITTTGNQTYLGGTSLSGNLTTTSGGSVSVSGLSTLTAPVAITTSGGGGISLGGVSGGGQSLALDAGSGSILLGADAAGLSTFMATGSSIGVRSVSSSGGQVYNGPAIIDGTLATTSNGGIQFAGPAQVSGHVLTTGGGILVQNGITIAGNLITNTTGAIEIAGATVLSGQDQEFRSSQGFISLGAVDSQDATRRSLTLVSGAPVAADGSSARIRLGGSVGAGNPLGVFQVGSPASQEGVPPISTAVFAPLFDAATGRVVAGSVDLANPASFTINADEFIMNKGEKITAFGDLTINAQSQALLRDVNSTGTLVVVSPTIRLAGRARSLLLPSGSSAPQTDIGLDLVGKNGITLNGSVLIENLDGGNEVTLGGDRISSIPTVSGGTIQTLQFEKGVSLESFQRTGGDPNFLLALDLRADGRTATNVATAIAGATPREADVGPDQTVGISASLKDQLQEIGIYIKELPLDQQVEFLTGRAIYNDLPQTANPSGGDFQITPNRLAVDRVRDVLEAFRSVKATAMLGADESEQWSVRASEILSDSAVACEKATGKEVQDLTGEEIARFIRSDPGQERSRNLLDAVVRFLSEIDDLGLSPGEAGVPRQSLYGNLTQSQGGLRTDQVAGLIAAYARAEP